MQKKLIIIFCCFFSQYLIADPASKPNHKAHASHAKHSISNPKTKNNHSKPESKVKHSKLSNKPLKKSQKHQRTLVSKKNPKHQDALPLKKSSSNKSKHQAMALKKTGLVNPKAQAALAHPNHDIPQDFINSKEVSQSPHLYAYSAIALNAKSGEILVSKRPNAKLPIASITKLMTAMVVLDSGVNLDDYVRITNDDIDTIRNTFSRLKVGLQFRRRDLLLLSLMSSENRAAHALGRTTFSGGLNTFISKMNQKAKALGMNNTQFYDPTGLTNKNQSTALDLSKLVQAAYNYQEIRQFTTTKNADVMFSPSYVHRYVNSDALVRDEKLQVELSKTGFINEAGHCLALYSIINQEPIVMVFLNSTGKSGRLVDAMSVKNYVQNLKRMTKMNASATTVEKLSLEEIRIIYTQPLFELITKAYNIHKKNFLNQDIELCHLVSVKTGGCPEDCGYCSQSNQHHTEIKLHALLSLEEVEKQAISAKQNGVKRMCLGAAYRSPPSSAIPKIADYIKVIKQHGLETCATLGQLTGDQAQQLKQAGLDYYNHNIDTSPEYYPSVTTTHSFADRLNTIANAGNAGIKICCGGIFGMGESQEDRISFIKALVDLPYTPTSIPINTLVKIKGTRLENVPDLDKIELARIIATLRIIFPKARIRLAAGRIALSELEQALCFMSGANSIFFGDKLLTTPNNSQPTDLSLINKLGMNVAG